MLTSSLKSDGCEPVALHLHPLTEIAATMSCDFAIYRASIAFKLVSHIAPSDLRRSVRPLSALLPAQFAESLEGRKVIIRTLEHTLSRCSYEVHVAGLRILSLWAHTDRSLTIRADEDTWTLDGLESSFGTFLLELGPHDAEFFDRWVVQKGRGG